MLRPVGGGQGGERTTLPLCSIPILDERGDKRLGSLGNMNLRALGAT